MDFEQALKDVGISPQAYITPDKLKAVSGKNIIVISIESLEQSFIDKTFGDITPNISNLSKKWTFFNNLEQTVGASWTSASLYAHQVGVPAFFKAQGNNNFKDITYARLTGLGNVLDKAGYNTRYIIGKKEFGGIDDILKAYNIKAISEKNSLGKYKQIFQYGFGDYDIFNEAKLWIKKFKQEKKPFALFVSTLNTHYPNGVYDGRMKKFVSKRHSTLEICISAVDELVGDFIRFVKEENLLDSTSIYIFPDHLMMGHSGKIIDKLKEKKRKLYLITNTNEKTLKKSAKDTIYQIDLPKLIINGAKIKTNANFLTDFIKEKNKNDFLRKNSVKLTSLNHASIDRGNFKDGINIHIKKPFLKLKSKTFSKNLYLPKSGSGILDIRFNSEMNYLYYSIGKLNNSKTLPKPNSSEDKRFKYIHLYAIVKNNKILSLHFRNTKDMEISKKSEPFDFSKKEILSLK